MIIQIMICILPDSPSDDDFRKRCKVEVIREIEQRLNEVKSNVHENAEKTSSAQKELLSGIKPL